MWTPFSHCFEIIRGPPRPAKRAGGHINNRGQKRQSMSFSMNIPPKDKQGVSMTAMVTLYCNKSLRSHDIIIFQSYGLAKKE